MGGKINNPVDGNLESPNLFPSETSKDQLYCHSFICILGTNTY